MQQLTYSFGCNNELINWNLELKAYTGALVGITYS